MLKPEIFEIIRKYYARILDKNSIPTYRGERLTTITEHINRLAKSMDFPSSIHVDITNHCNMECDFCFMKDRYKENIFPLGYMDFELFKYIVDEAVMHYPGQPEIFLYKDGEPLMHPEFDKFASYAKNRKCFVSTATNGLLLWDRRDDIINSEIDLITISMENEVALENIRKFIQYKKTRLPIVQMKIFLDHTWHYNIDFPNVDNVLLSVIYKEKNREATNRTPCPTLLFNPSITWDGYMLLCCTDWRREGMMGNIKDKPIKTMWDDIQRISIQQAKGYFISPCSRCHKSEELASNAHELLKGTDTLKEFKKNAKSM